MAFVIIQSMELCDVTLVGFGICWFLPLLAVVVAVIGYFVWLFSQNVKPIKSREVVRNFVTELPSYIVSVVAIGESR